ncbi:MAG TPA: deoxyribonuclease IV [bacterium]|nr:deoxyribonuclease IV [bacterium]HPL95729.1 deoxyribonuclease IV [bacterium]
MLIGAHISAANGVFNAPLNAAKIGCECYQFFTRPPQGGPAPKLTPAIIKLFKKNNNHFGFKEYYIHAPYFINLASNKNNIYYGSISVLKEELKRGSDLEVKYLMTHLGSAKDLGRSEALNKVSGAIEKILNDYQGATQFLIEMSAGSGEIIGATFEEIGIILKKIKPEIRKKIGICFDTAHAFASGYDLRDKEKAKKVWQQFDKIIGLKNLKLIHLNDSLSDLNSRRDRHAPIGQGKIGLKGIEALIKNKKMCDINLISETPGELNRKEDIKILKKLRNKR